MKRKTNNLNSFEKYALKNSAGMKVRGGFTATDDLWKWRKNIEDGMIDRRSGTVK